MANIFALVLFMAYVVLVGILSFMANRRTKSVETFSAGNGDMGISVVALSLASSFTSAATLMAMPGYIYQAGISGIVYFNVFQTAGLLTGLLIVGRKVRMAGISATAVSIPQWLGKKYNSKALGHFFAAQSIFLITFMVLIVMLMAEMLSGVFSLNFKIAVVLISIYVFGYSLLGGSYGHGWTGLVQSIIMIAAVVWLVKEAIPGPEVWKEFTTEIIKEEPYYFKPVNPDSILFKDYFTVGYCAFIMGFCNIFQPHIFNKALFLKKEKSWAITSILGIIVISIFNLILITGMFIRIKYPGLTNYDTVMNYYIINSLGKRATAIIFVTVMAAAMSTLNGVIVGMCSNIGSDIIPERVGKKKSLLYVRLIVAAVGVCVILLSLNPPQFLAVIGMWGYNVLMSASLVPMVCSLWAKEVSVISMFVSSITAIILFIILMGLGITINGAWACGFCIPASVMAFFMAEGIIRWKRKANENNNC